MSPDRHTVSCWTIWARRSSLTPTSDLGQLLAGATRIEYHTIDRSAAIRRAEAYDGKEVIAIETRRQVRREEQIASARKRFIESPILIFPAGNEFNYSFDPNAVVAVDDTSTLYNGKVQVTDDWGILQSSDGVLMVRQGGRIVRVQVPAPAETNARPLKANHWTLELKGGWTVAPASRPGDLTLQRTSR